ncbi:MAG: N-acetylmuramoyl-L-alanine amidase, partial [Clostridium sp.]
GVKVTNWLVIYTCKCLGISSALLETCFIDNKADMAEYQANKESIAQGIVDGIAEGFQLKANSTEQKPGNKPAAQNKPFKPAKPAQPDQILHKGEYFVIPGVHSVDQVLANMDSIWCEEMTGNGGNSIQAGPLTKCDKNGKKTKSQVFSVGDYWKCDKKFKVLAVDKPTNSVQANVGGRKIWLYAGPLREV